MDVKHQNLGLSTTSFRPLACLPAVVEVIRGIGRHSLSHVVDVFRGNNTATVRKHRHEQVAVHGLGRGLMKTNAEAERLVRHMVIMVRFQRELSCIPCERKQGQQQVVLGVVAGMRCYCFSCFSCQLEV